MYQRRTWELRKSGSSSRNRYCEGDNKDEQIYEKRCSLEPGTYDLICKAGSCDVRQNGWNTGFDLYKNNVGKLSYIEINGEKYCEGSRKESEGLGWPNHNYDICEHRETITIK